MLTIFFFFFCLVSEATGQVVASAQSGSQLRRQGSERLDYSKLSLTQAKRLEMESQVKALELEKELEMERTRLAELRKVHYHLAGASEGWEEVRQLFISLSLSQRLCVIVISFSIHAGTDRELAAIVIIVENPPC